MFDSTLRPVKDQLLTPLTRTPLGKLHPTTLSVVGLLSTLAAAVAGWQQAPVPAVALWLLGRAFDGLDGAVARAGHQDSDVGGLLDFMFDSIGYAAVPIGLAFGVDTRAGWIATALLLGAFYLNAVSLGYVAALLEKGERVTDRVTSAVLPRGLIEGTETIVFFSVALAVPGASPTIWAVMAAAVTFTALERVRWAAGVLR